jgi:hypothetical protein
VGEPRQRGGVEEEPERGDGEFAAAAEDVCRGRRREAGLEAAQCGAEVVPRASEVAEHAAERAHEMRVRLRGIGARRIRPFLGRRGGAQAARKQAARRGPGERPGEGSHRETRAVELPTTRLWRWRRADSRVT